jgi:general secretion pathway protein D
MGNRKIWLSLMIVAVLSTPALADRGDGEYKHGVQAERKGNYDEAYALYKQAYTLNPTNPKYIAAYAKARFAAASAHIHNGQFLRNTGAMSQALAEFQKAAEIDSTSFLAQQELRRTEEMISREERQKVAPKAPSPLASLAESLGGSVELQPLSKSAITLHLTANADLAYKTICKLAGLNLIFDPDYRAQKITVDLTDVTLRDALDLVRLQSKTFWRPVLSNTIFVAADTPAKRKEYEQNVLKTFYLQNLSTPAELQEAANVVRQVLDVSRVQLLQAQDALILRGTPDQMVLAEKLLSDIDKPKSEVIIDVAVMQVTRDRVRALGTNVPNSYSVGVLGGDAGGNGSFTLKNIKHMGSGNFSLSVPSVSFTALATDSNTKLLQNPEIRALNDEKATLRIGDRIPIATGSFSAGVVGGGSVSPLVNTQFQYIDVGVNIDITPHIHADNEVTLKLSLEISSVTGSQTIGGVTEPTIGQRRIEHETRLKDGEINLLGGILEDSETQSMSGFPIINKIPILKYLFGQDNRDHRENEIVFAITPHIVRSLDVTEQNQRMIDIGTGSAIELRPRETPQTPAATPEHPAEPAKPQGTPAPKVPESSSVRRYPPAETSRLNNPGGRP